MSDMSTRSTRPTRPCPPIQPRRGMRRGMQPHDGTGQLMLPPPPTAPRDWDTRPTVRVPAVTRSGSVYQLGDPHPDYLEAMRGQSAETDQLLGIAPEKPEVSP